MKQPEKWNVVLFAPDEAEVSLLAEFAERADAKLLAVIDPGGNAVGSAIAEVMGTPILQEWDPTRLATAGWLVHPVNEAPPAEVLRLAYDAGVRIVTGPMFRLAFKTTVDAEAESPDPGAADSAESDDVHRTLSRIEEALDRDSLLRWLLSLVTRAVDADEGSIMLLDDKTDELYVAFSYGLSDEVFFGTRVALGVGIAGEVARTRHTRLITGAPENGLMQDRGDITSAICTPLITGDRLIGVMNVNVTGDEKALGPEHVVIVDRLAERMALILNRFLTLQRARASELFSELDDELRDLTQDTKNIETVIAAWAGTLAMGLKAHSLSVALACADGSLLVGEGSSGGTTKVYYASLENPAWREVFEQGIPLVVREVEETSSIDEGVTIFYLPVGHGTVQAVLTIEFSSPKAAHDFNKISGEYMSLLEQRLTSITDRIDLEDRLCRMSELAVVLGDIAGRRDEDLQVALGRLRAGACRLTGAGRAYLVVADGPDGVELAAPDSVDDERWLSEAGRLLDEARNNGWRVTLLSDVIDADEEQVCLLAIPANDKEGGPGLILRQKERLHQLDGKVFTEFDGELAGHLARLTPMLLAGHPEMVTSVPAAPPAADPQMDVEAMDGPIGVVQDESGSDRALLTALRREMARCDRYHSTFALNAFCAKPKMLWDESMTENLLGGLGEGVRSSDCIFSRPDGTILMITPEDVQSLGKLHARIVDILRDLAGGDYCEILTSKATYPGNYDGAEALLRKVTDKLDL